MLEYLPLHHPQSAGLRKFRLTSYMTIAELEVLAAQIKNETNPGANTNVRLGTLFEELIQTLANRTPIPLLYSLPDGYISTYRNSQSAVARTLNVNVIYFDPLYVYEETTFSDIGFAQKAGTSGRQCRMGIYDSVDNEPLNLIAGSPVIINPGGADTYVTNDFDVPITLSPGLYYVAYLSNATYDLYGIDANSYNFPVLVDLPGGAKANPFNGSYLAVFSYNNLPSDTSALALTINDANLNFVLRLNS